MIEPTALPPPDVSRPRKKRRRHLASVRSLLILLALVAIPLAWYANRVHERRRALRTIFAHNGGIYYDFEVDGGKFPKDPVSPVPAWLRRGVGTDHFHNIVWVRIERSPSFSDEDLARIRALDAVEALGIVGTAITDEGMRHFRGWGSLKALFLDDSAVTDAGVDALGLETFPQLSVLALRGTRVTPEKARAIQKRFPDMMILYEGIAPPPGLSPRIRRFLDERAVRPASEQSDTEGGRHPRRLDRRGPGLHDRGADTSSAPSLSPPPGRGGRAARTRPRTPFGEGRGR